MLLCSVVFQWFELHRLSARTPAALGVTVLNGGAVGANWLLCHCGMRRVASVL